MTASLPPDDARLNALYRERNGDPRHLAAERDRPVPAAPGHPVPPRRRGEPTTAPTATHSYAAQHARMRAWLHDSHEQWQPELYTLSDAAAHIVIEHTPTYALALCGESGYPHLAPDAAPPCHMCSSFVR